MDNLENITQTVVFSLLDVFLCANSGFAYVLGVDSNKATVAIRISGYTPYFYAHDVNNDQDENQVIEWSKSIHQKVGGFLATEKGKYNGIDIAKQKLLFGYSDNIPITLRLYCNSSSTLTQCARAILNSGFKTYEHEKDMRLAFLRENNLTMYGTITVQNPTPPKQKQQKFSRCDSEYYCNISQVHCTPYQTFPPIIVAAYDLETEGLNAEKDSVFQVSICIRHFPFQETSINKKYLICSIEMNQQADQGFTAIIVPDEKSLITEFVDIIVKEKVTLLCGWNNLGFDAPFLYKRAKILHCLTSLERLSFLLPHICRMQLKEKNLDSSAFGTNHFHTFAGLHGLVEMDGLLMARKSSSLKLNSYSLNNVAKELLNSAKDDVNYQEIVKAVREKDPDLVFKVAHYCVQDSALVLQIFDYLKEVDNAIVTASLANVPLSYIAERGQSCKTVSLMFQEACKKKFIWNQLKRQKSDSKYQGSTVIDSITGLYTSPTAVMDFNSLYPSIIIAYGLSPEALVGTETGKWTGNDLDLAFYDQDQLRVYIGNDTFAVFKTVEDPVVPTVLKTLIAGRKAVRKQMTLIDPSDKLSLSQLNAKQLALKILANSCYGAMGNRVGPFPVVEIAASTTAIGRMSIEKVRTTLASLGYDKIIAGDTDSVMLLLEGMTVSEAIEKANFFCEKHLNPIFPPPMKIEFEKIFLPYCVLTKKRYFGLLWTSANSAPKKDVKGLANKRRDFAGIVKQTMDKIMDIILWSNDTQAALQYIQDTLKNLLEDKLPRELLTIRKELKKRPSEYVTPNPQSSVAAKMLKSDPEHAPKVGERVAFFISQGKEDISVRAEPPQNTNAKVDKLYYLNHQLRNPVSEIFSAIGYKTEITKVFNYYEMKIINQERRQHEITSFFT